jgi:hypothetical protein
MASVSDGAAFTAVLTNVLVLIETPATRSLGAALVTDEAMVRVKDMIGDSTGTLSGRDLDIENCTRNALF